MEQKTELEGPVFQITDYAFQSSYYDTGVKLVDEDNTGWTIFINCEDLYAKANRHLVNAVIGWYSNYWYWCRQIACVGIKISGASDYVQNNNSAWIKSAVLRADLRNNTFKIIVNQTWIRSYAITTHQASTTNVKIGTSTGYSGTVKTLQIWKRPLSDAEINKLFA